HPPSGESPMATIESSVLPLLQNSMVLFASAVRPSTNSATTTDACANAAMGPWFLGALPPRARLNCSPCQQRPQNFFPDPCRSWAYSFVLWSTRCPCSTLCSATTLKTQSFP